MIRGVLFDMDGLMFDTERLGLEGWLEAGRQLGLPITEDFVLQIRGRNKADSRQVSQQMFGPGFDYDAAKAFRDRYADEAIHTRGVPVKPGLVSLLQALQERGIPAALATSTAREKALEYLRLAGVEGYFSAAVCGDEVTRSKPDPEIFCKAAAKLGLAPADCLVLEDSPYGIQAAAAAGCVPMMIPDMTPPQKSLRGLCAAVLPSLADVPAWLDEQR